MHKKSLMRSVQVELCWQGLESHSLISDRKQKQKTNYIYIISIVEICLILYYAQLKHLAVFDCKGCNPAIW